MANVITKSALKKSTWKDAGAGVFAGAVQSISSAVTGNPFIGSLITAVVVGAVPNKFVFDETNKTAIIVNTMQDVTNAVLLG